MFRIIALSLAAFCAAAQPAAAETLRVEGIAPAGSDEALLVETIAVEHFVGSEGAFLRKLVRDRFADISLNDEAWFSLVPPREAGAADAILVGSAQPSFSESYYRETRQVCDARDKNGECVAWADVEARCVQSALSFAPDLTLTNRDGEPIWGFRASYRVTENFCPSFDGEPDFEAVLAGWMRSFANAARANIAPAFAVRDIRIMEGRGGLDRDTKRLFKDAVGLTKKDQAAACDMFEALWLENPDQPSLLFNTGLCAEQLGDFEVAEARYAIALENKKSDDEAKAGMRRLGQWRHADWQLAQRFAYEEPAEELDAANVPEADVEAGE